MRFEAVLHVGDFGIWPDPNRVDRATRDHEGAGDFPRWLSEGRAPPLPTWFIKGNHEDFEWLDSRPSTELLPGLHHIPNGHVVEVGQGEGKIRVGGIGGCHGPSDYLKPSHLLKGYARRHYTLDEIERLRNQGRVDLLLLHDAPRGITITKGTRSGDTRTYTSLAEGLDVLVTDLRPIACFFGHHHARLAAELDGIPCHGLNIVGRPGTLVAADVNPGGHMCRILGEWPAPGVDYRPVWPTR